MSENQLYVSEKDKSLVQYFAAVTLALIGVFCILVLYFTESFGGSLNTNLKITIASVSSTLLAASFVSGAFEIYFRNKFSNALRIQIRETISQELSTFNSSQSKGIRNVYSDLGEAMSRLDINNKIVNEQDIMILQTWMPTIDTLKDSLKAMHQKGGRARVLCLTEDCIVSQIRATFIKNFGNEHRDDDEGYKSDQYLKANVDIRDTKRTITEIFGKNSVRQYEIFPAFSLYIIGNVILMGHFLIDKNSFASMQIEVAKDSLYGRELVDYFEKLWDKSV